MIFKTKRIPLTAMQKALYTNLSACQTIPVFDHIPEDVVIPPYITLGATTFKPCGPKGMDIYACSIQLHVWSEYEGKAEVNSIMNDIATVLSTAPIDMSADNFRIVTQDVTFFEAYEADPHGYHGVVTLDMQIEDLEV